MKLGKLLAAGKSIINGNGSIEYRTNKQVALPKFSVPKHPLVHSSKPSSGGDGAPRPAAPPAAADSKPAATWSSRFNPVSAWRGARTPEPEPARPQVQAELSLDTVKVVHNDLSDADVEVVPIKSRPMPAPDLPPARKPWEILGERLMKATAL